MLSDLHLKILQIELDQNADATRVDDRIAGANNEIARLQRRQPDLEQRQKAIVGIRDSAVLSIRDVRKNMQQRAVKAMQMQSWLDEYLGQCSRLAEDEYEDTHFRERLFELLARTATPDLPDLLREACQAGHLARAELIRFEFQTRNDRHAFMPSFEAITGRLRHHDPVEMRNRLANICNAIRNVDSRLAELITRSQCVRLRAKAPFQPGSGSKLDVYLPLKGPEKEGPSHLT